MSARADLTVRRADIADAETIGRLLDAFNREFEEPTPGPYALAHKVRTLLAAGEMTALLGGAGPHGVAVLRFRPALWTEGLDATSRSSTSSPGAEGPVNYFYELEL